MEINISQVFSGVWKMTFGTPERLKPTSYQEHQAKKEELSRLPEVKLPFELGSISFRKSAQGCVLKLPLKAGEGIYGFGLQLKSFNQSGKKKLIRNNADPKSDSGDSHAPVPFYVSTDGYGVFVDSARYVSFYCGSNKIKGQSELNAKQRRETLVYTEEDLYGTVLPEEDRFMLIEVPASEGVDIYLFGGPDIKTAVQRYNLFSGSGCLPPLWGLGIWYRTFSGFKCKESIKILDEFRKDNIPCDVLGLEPGWHSYSYPCSYKWDEVRGEGHEDAVKYAADNNARLNLWEHAFVHPSSPIYNEIKPHSPEWEVWGGLVMDFASPECREPFNKWHEEQFVDKGISGFKLDECDGSDYTGSWSFPNSTEFKSGLDGEQMHNLIGNIYQNSLYTIYRKKGIRTYNLVRCSHALAAPLPYVLYSDLYDHKDFIRGIVNSGFTGLLWTPELRHADSVEDMIRRLQTVIFSAQALVNAWYLPNPPWFQIDSDKNKENIPMDNFEELKCIVRDLFQLRMSLLPYLYSAFAEYWKKGTPPFRALIMDYPDDKEARNIDNQYMMGESLLIAPVIAGEKRKRVYLPEGEWFNFFSGEKLCGGWYEFDVELNTIPVFVKSGTILPIAKPMEFIPDNYCFEIEAKIYGDNPKPCKIYEDDGISFEFENGRYNEVIISYENGGLKLNRNGNYGVNRIKLLDV